MGDLAVDVDPAEVGMDARRLSLIDRHFARYIDDGRLPGCLVVVIRRGRVVHLSVQGHRNVEAALPVRSDTLWRIYSMTKPITSVAAMMLVEQACVDLSDPISRYLPDFASPRVYHSGSALHPVTVSAIEPIRLWHLLTHTAGLTYGFDDLHPVGEIYRAHGYQFVPTNTDLAGACTAWAKMPLLFQPGTRWNYSVASDVLARVIEVVSGQPLDEFFTDRIFEPLGMTDTCFAADVSDPHRLAVLYNPEPRTGRVTPAPLSPVRTSRYLGGGSGLVSTARDYHRFTQMLLGGGELDGVRLLGSPTVAAMTRNQLPGNQDLSALCPVAADSPMHGHGFGFGLSVLLDPAATKTLSSAGEYGWDGAASTIFWVDPAEDLTAMFFTQLLPSTTHPIRSQLHSLIYQAITD